MRRLVHAVNVGLVLLLFAGSLWAYPSLPDQMPSHFGITGEVDAYWQTTFLRWLLVPSVAVGTIALIYGPLWIIGTLPVSWLNVPNRERFEALGAADKHAIRDRVQGLLYGLATVVLVVFGALQSGIYYVARTSATALPWLVRAVIVAGLLGVGGIVVWLAWRLPVWIEERADSS